MKRLIIFISVIILVSFILILGFFSPYNCYTARRELRTHHIEKVLINDEYIWIEIEKKIGEKYGINVIDISNFYKRRPINYLGIKIYNKIMMHGFIRSNGEVNYKKYKTELDSLLIQHIAI